MNTNTRKNRPERFFVYLLLLATVFTLSLAISTIPPAHVSAHSGNVFNSGCGKATIDGNVGSAEWTHASTLTFPLVSPGTAAPLTATLYVMNSKYYLYMGITINDDEYSTVGQYLQQGDSVVINFDDDHTGDPYQLNNDVLALGAGVPQFGDRYLYNLPTSNQADTIGGGTTNGIGASSRVDILNHFEVQHPLCSGDALDFCLHPSDTVGFKLRYLDAEANGDFGSAQYFPGPTTSSEADIVIGTCSVAENTVYLPLIKR